MLTACMLTPHPAYPSPPPQVSSQEALEYSKIVAREEGLLVGISSGATFKAATTVRRLMRGEGGGVGGGAVAHAKG